MNLRFYHFVSGVNQGNGRSGGEFQISSCYLRGLGASPELYSSKVVEFNACRVFVDD